MKISAEQLRQRLHHEKAYERRLALILIGRNRVYELVDEVIIILLDDNDTNVRAMAAWALDLIGSAETIPALVAAMYDMHFDVRSNAGWALVHLAQRLIPEVLLSDMIDVLQDETSPQAQEMAYLVLARIDHQEARRAIDLYWKAD